jgi:aerobic-type carbon monoxide dehydrogenase small subunit (CoxS/CutS family)
VIVPVRLNGAEVELEARADESLLTALRRHGLRSVRATCEIGVCGVCTVLVDGQALSSCLLLAPAAHARDILTMEGVADDDPTAAAFVDQVAYQCGYCTPGFVLTVKALLAESPRPTEEEIRSTLAGNLCRCGSYRRILRAARQAAGLGPG